MTKRMTAKYSGRCRECTGTISPGDRIVWCGRRETYHEECFDNPREIQPNHFGEGGEPEPDPEWAQARRDEADYQRGVADANNFMENRRWFGDAIANQMEIEREIREGWDY